MFLLFFVSLLSCFSNKVIDQRMTTSLVITQEIILKCEKESSTECKMIGSSVTGTATRIKWEDNYYWLTAAHVCSTAAFSGQVSMGRIVSFRVGGSNEEEVSKSITFNVKKDLCIIPAKPGPHRVISSHNPSLGSRVSLVAYPGGAFDPRMLPIYEGRYAGQFEDMCSVTIPVSGGSSGSSVLNDDLEIVGVVSAVMKTFNHFTIVTCLTDVRAFLSLAAEQAQKFESQGSQILTQPSDLGAAAPLLVE